MDRKTFTIGILMVTAVVLFIAQFMPVRQAYAAEAVSDGRDYQLVTSRSIKGGESLYIFHRKSGQVAVFSWEAGERRVKLRAIRSINDAILQ